MKRLVPIAKDACPHCGAAPREGVWLTQRRVQIFDAIKRAGSGGLPADALAMKANLFRQNVYHLNVDLEATDYRVVSDGRMENNRYRLVKVR